MPATLRLGASGPDVTRLQQLLNQNLKPSPNLKPDGDFGHKTLQAVQRFQQSKGLTPNGVVGSRTWAALEGKPAQPTTPPPQGPTVPLPATDPLSEEAKYDYYVLCISRALGNTAPVLIDLKSGQRVIVGLRKLTSMKEEFGGIYDDRIVVLWEDSKGKHASEFVANTEPSAYYEDLGDGKRAGNKSKSAEGRDADGDGRKDLGRLPEGIYVFRKDSSKDHGNILRPTHDIIVDRDTNHDGVFDAQDKVTDADKLNSGKSILFHKGSKSRTGSAGCQTFQPDVFNLFWDALGAQTDFRYVLLHTQRCPQMN